METGTLFRLEDYLDSEECFHLSKNRLSRDSQVAYHHHNYFELFWVASGRCTHHLNGHRMLLDPGRLVCLRPSDCHSFEFASRAETIVIYNLAFFQNDVEVLRDRYFGDREQFFWTSDPQPVTVYLNPARLQQLSLLADHILEAPRKLFFLDRLLLQVFELLHFAIDHTEMLPYWLQQAIRTYREKLSQGYSGLQTVDFLTYCKRSNTHVNRVLRTYFGTNLSSYLNQLRLARARTLLATTSKSVKEVAYEVGYNDVSYYHRVFKKTYGISPAEFRKKNILVF